MKSYDNISNNEYNCEDRVDYYIQNCSEFYVQDGIIFETKNNGCSCEITPIFGMDNMNKVCANVESSTDDMTFVIKEKFLCDICNKILEDSDENMKYIKKCIYKYLFQ